MDGRRDGSGHPRWSASRSGAGPPSEKPVSSYASLACGPPPSYARQERQGSSGASWDYDDKPVRAASPVGRGPGVPYHSGGGAGRYSSDRGGGRGRGMRGGGRERNDRIERFSSSGQHRNSPERFQSGYESGEILPSQRAGTSQGPNQRRLDDLPFEGRDSRSGGNSSGRFTFRGGGGRDAGGRTGRFPGRFVDRGGGGRGGRADFRPRRGTDNRDYYTGRSSPEDSSRNDDGPRYLPGDKRSEPIHQRGDDRIMQQNRSYPGPRYSSLASNNPPDPRPEDRYIKRRRDEEDYPIDFEEKRSRNGDYVSRGRPAPNEEGGRFTQGALSLRASDEPPGDFDLRQLSRPGGDMRDRRGLDSNRAQLDRPPIRSSDVAVPPEEQRSRLMIDPMHKGDVRSRPGNINEGSYDDRIRRSVNEDLRLDRLDRGDSRHRGEVNSRRFVPARDDPRGVSGPPPSNLREEPPLSRYVADSRIPLDASRPRDPRDTHIARPQQRFDDRGPDRYNDSGVSTDSRSVDNRPPPVSTNALERNRDPRSGTDFRSGRQTEIDHIGDNRPTRGGGMVGRSDDPRNGNSGDGWPSQNSSSQHVYDPPHNRTTNWNSSQSNDRSPIPSPRTVRGTMPPPTSLDSIISDPGSMVPGPLPFAGKGGGSIPDGRDYLSGREGRGGRGGGGGRGFGFRGGGGRGGGRSEFGGGRYSSMGDGGREENNYSLGPKPPGIDQPFHSKGSFKRYPGGDARPETEDSIPPEFGVKVKKSDKPPVKLEKSGNVINSGSSDTIQNRGVGGSLGGMQMKSGDSSSPPSSSAVASPAVDNNRIDDKNEKKPRPISPPPKGEPSGIMKALVRLLDLEASMEYAYAKHMQLVKKQQELKAQAVILKDLPVGLDAFKEDLDALEATASMYDIE